jgi:creatinine amidohydrolase
MADQMRTRFLNKMTNTEIEAYLQKNDILFIPVGTIETHGQFPVDIELTVPEAFSLKMAEKVDGLVLSGLQFFFAGATVVGRSTVQMSISKGAEYLKELSYSLLNQGFRRQIFVSLHGPAFMTIGTVVLEVFDETKVPISYIDLMTVMIKAKGKLPANEPGEGDFWFGAYEILNRKDELIIDPESRSRIKDDKPFDESTDFFSHLQQLAGYAYAVGFHYANPDDHGCHFGALRSVEERDELCRNGVRQIEELVEYMDLPKYVQQQRELDKWTDTYIKNKYEHLPKLKFGKWE